MELFLQQLHHGDAWNCTITIVPFDPCISGLHLAGDVQLEYVDAVLVCARLPQILCEQRGQREQYMAQVELAAPVEPAPRPQ